MHLLDPDDDRPYSSWDVATHGPDPRPGWVVTELSALDTELGILKTGKEADVHLVHRGVPDTPGTLLAAKRYRPAERRMFHRDAGYTEGRRVRRSRATRAMCSSPASITARTARNRRAGQLRPIATRPSRPPSISTGG